MPFFNVDERLAWDVRPTGEYGVDCETGRDYARQFLASCDGTWGWSALLPKIVHDMARGGTRTNKGHNGVIIGFMGVITDCVMLALRDRDGMPGGAA